MDFVDRKVYGGIDLIKLIQGGLMSNLIEWEDMHKQVHT